eukprot:2791420-Prymnesium_polylepis.1
MEGWEERACTALSHAIWKSKMASNLSFLGMLDPRMPAWQCWQRMMRKMSDLTLGVSELAEYTRWRSTSPASANANFSAIASSQS